MSYFNRAHRSAWGRLRRLAAAVDRLRLDRKDTVVEVNPDPDRPIAGHRPDHVIFDDLVGHEPSETLTLKDIEEAMERMRNDAGYRGPVEIVHPSDPRLQRERRLRDDLDTRPPFT